MSIQQVQDKQKIVPHLWFDKEAKEAAEFYVSTFGQESKVMNISTLHNTPSPGGDTDIVSFELLGQEFMAMSAGPLFKFNPSISFALSFKTKEEVDATWNKLIVGGKALMELGTYPFNERYGWLEDKYGLSWQVGYGGETPNVQSITPTLMFVGAVCGKAEEAMQFYISIFKNAAIAMTARYEKGMEPNKEGTIMYGSFTLEGQQFAAMDSALSHAFTFNEAISLIVKCEDQKEIDYYWEKLSAVPESEQCGWLKDKYGVSWQIVPTAMDEMMEKGTKEQIDRVTQAFLPMKKFDIAKLREAYSGGEK